MLTFGELLLVQGGVNMINKMVKEGKCSIFLNSLVCFVVCCMFQVPIRNTAFMC
jgi:hypothetical protein